MRKFLWFISGCGLTLVLGAVVMFGSLQESSADDPTEPPTSRPTSPAPTRKPRIEPSPTARSFSLSWQRGSIATGSWDRLTVGDDTEVYYAPRGEGPRLARLTPDEWTTYLVFAARYAAFDRDVGGAADGSSDATARICFSGRGTRVPTEAEQAEVEEWAESVYKRLTLEERRADIVAIARLRLAGRLGVSADAIRTASVEAVTWPDACLGIQREGTFCAKVLTPGYRILLGMAALTYECRTDLHGLVRVIDPPTPTPKGLPQEPLPTATPWPTPSPVADAYWLGEYYASVAFGVAPALIRRDKSVSFDWGQGAPGPGFPANGFSIRWTRTLILESGRYRFWARADDGVRFYLDGQLLIDEWHASPGRSYQRHIDVASGTYSLVVEYYEQADSARIAVGWELLPPPTTTPA